MKNIGLLQVDGKFPNLAIMKISQYHKNLKNNVEWLNYMNNYDVVYLSKIFKFSKIDTTIINAKEIIKGGTGIDIKKKLPNAIENCNADYSIYPSCNYSLQIFSRGCIRKCFFCVVNEKEGDITPINPINLNPKGLHIEVLDNNFFASPNWLESIELLIKWKQPVNFHGIDIRILREKQAFYLNKIKLHKQIHVAWDNPKENLKQNLFQLTQWINPYKIMCYVLIGFNSTKEEDLYRIETINKMGITPFVMPFNKSDKYQAELTRFVNKRWIYKSCNGDFDKYKHNGLIQTEVINQKKIQFN